MNSSWTNTIGKDEPFLRYDKMTLGDGTQAFTCHCHENPPQYVHGKYHRVSSRPHRPRSCFRRVGSVARMAELADHPNRRRWRSVRVYLLEKWRPKLLPRGHGDMRTSSLDWRRDYLTLN